MSSRLFAHLEELLFEKVKLEKIGITKRGFIYLSDSTFVVPISKIVELYNLKEECFLITELVHNQLLPDNVEVELLVSSNKSVCIVNFFRSYNRNLLDRQIIQGVYAGLNGKELFDMLDGKYMIDKIEKAAENLVRKLVNEFFEEVLEQYG